MDGPMAKKSDAEVALEMYESVQQADAKERRLKSSTFWNRFHVKRRTLQVIERIEIIMTKQNLNISLKSGAEFGKEGNDDWMTLTIWPPNGDTKRTYDPNPSPPVKWFDDMKTRKFEGEKEVEYCFVMPLLEKLGYGYDDIAIGHPVKMFEGVRHTTKHADFVLFNGTSRKSEDVLVVIEAKNNEKTITDDNIGQAKSYARQLLPACYAITNGQQTMVFRFNGMLYQDERVMNFETSELDEVWADLLQVPQ